ncbi:MAG: flagellar motor switch phosphatase FliY [Eubacteriales bacterium]
MSDNNVFTSMEIDGIGEILNISLGSSATAMSDMLGRKVTITTPSVKLRTYEEFDMSEVYPAVGVEITYVTGLDGNNLMLLKRDDVRKILEILMYTEIDPETFELDELSLSAVCELMNQMMGASATALADVIGRMVNISTPVAFEVENVGEFKQKYFNSDEELVEVSFHIDIENTFSSKFLTMLSVSLCKELIASFGFIGKDGEPVKAEPVAEAVAQQPQAPASEPTPAPAQAPPPVQPAAQVPPQMMPMQGGMPMQQMPMYDTQPRLINVQPLTQNYEITAAEAGTNLNLIMKVPLQVSVEIGRTKKLVKEILEFGQGSLIVLDKLAGDQVDVYVNGQCIAKGDVVVVDDNFGVRITEVVQKTEIINSL